MNHTPASDDDLRSEYEFRQLPIVARGSSRKKTTESDQLESDVASQLPDEKDTGRFEKLRGIATVQMSTDEIMALTRDF